MKFTEGIVTLIKDMVDSGQPSNYKDFINSKVLNICRIKDRNRWSDFIFKLAGEPDVFNLFKPKVLVVIQYPIDVDLEEVDRLSEKYVVSCKVVGYAPKSKHIKDLSSYDIVLIDSRGLQDLGMTSRIGYLMFNKGQQYLVRV